MTRLELEHAIRAACDLTSETEVFVFGSQAILGEFPDAPEEIRQSAEADIAPKHATDKIDLIDGVLGQDSMFHKEHGFYVHGVPIETAVLPVGWETRSFASKTETRVSSLAGVLKLTTWQPANWSRFEKRTEISCVPCSTTGWLHHES